MQIMTIPRKYRNSENKPFSYGLSLSVADRVIRSAQQQSLPPRFFRLRVVEDLCDPRHQRWHSSPGRCE